jgi:glutathione S-transferase
MKAEMLLKLSGLEYQTSTKGFKNAPKGKLPYIDDNGTVVADSTLIRLHLAQKHAINFDRGLPERERGVAWAIEKMLEDHVYWAMVYWRWLIDANFDRGPRTFFKGVPAIIRPVVTRMVRKQVRARLHGQGFGRHSEAEMTTMACRAYDSLSQILGANRYLMGDGPCGADATAFAFVAGSLANIFESPLQKKAASLTNLVAYNDRMMAEFYPGFGAQQP